MQTCPLLFLEVCLNEELELEKKLIKEGMHAHCGYSMLLMMISAAYSKLGKAEESRKYDEIIEKFRSFAQDEWRHVNIDKLSGTHTH